VGKKRGVKHAELLPAALGAAAGPVLVLDAGLRVAAASPEAEALLGFPVPLGASAPQLLCGDGPKRPVAEALAEGRSVQAVVPRPLDVSALLRVRAVPVGERQGWLLLLEDAGEAAPEGPVLFHGMWTQNAKMKQLFRLVERVAESDATVLVRGETGAGKELVAHAVHALSPRAKGPFRALNCAALPPNLLESELFGHARGAFTGALRDVQGHVQLAHKGTLFLDEVAELPLELQAKLLRVIETQTVLPVGGREPIPVDVRIVSATHRALRKEVEAGRFRADLMYRLRVIPIFLPPLRERAGDVPLLAQRIVEQLNEKSRRKVERVAPAALRVLERHDWPGNVRELRNVLAYAFAVGDGPVLQATDLPPELLEEGPAAGPEAVVEPPREPAPSGSPEAARIADALRRSGGSRARAAKLLGISRITLWRRMKEHGLVASHER
jgi:transcriptional regulator with PAS, ATPase and Fis domain